jgi:elongation factor P
MSTEYFRIFGPRFLAFFSDFRKTWTFGLLASRLPTFPLHFPVAFGRQTRSPFPQKQRGEKSLDQTNHVVKNPGLLSRDTRLISTLPVLGKTRTTPIKSIMAVPANDLRRGQAIDYNGEICVVLDVQHRTPGNLRAFVQATLRSIRSGRSSDVRFSSTEKVETVPMMTKKMEFSYKDGDDFVFTDPENYETVTLVPELVGDAKNYLVENGSVTVTFVEDKAVTVEIPPSVVLTVTDAPEGIRGDSANNVQKAVTVETGITVQAPLFIKTGEKIKIDTRTGKYMERA